MKYDGTNDIFKFNKNIDLQSTARISNSLNPVNSQDLVTKSFLESSIGGFGSVSSIGITTNINGGIIVTNSPITSSGNINLSLSSNLQDFNILGYGSNGQVLTSNNGTYSWVTPQSGGNVIGSSNTTVNGLALWNNATGTSLGSTNLTLDVNGNLNLNSKRIVSAQDPVSAQDYSTKNYVDTLISDTFRTGSVVVGDIGGTTGTVNLTVSGGIQAATKRNGYSTGDSFIDVTYSDKGYIPSIFCFVLNTTPFNSGVNDIFPPILLSSTNTTTRIYLEEQSGIVQNVTLNILLIKPNLT
jgi:hypothetical protein